MIVNVFFLAAAGDSILYGLKSLLRPIVLALRPSGLQLKAIFGWIVPRAHPPQE